MTANMSEEAGTTEDQPLIGIEDLPQESPDAFSPNSNSSPDYDHRSLSSDSNSFAGHKWTHSAISHWRSRRFLVILAITGLWSFLLFQLYQTIVPDGTISFQICPKHARWFAIPRSWLPKGFCGSSNSSGRGRMKGDKPFPKGNSTRHRAAGGTNPKDWSETERALREIPAYVLEYAPFVHLFSGEEYWPCDMAEHLIHTTPHLDYIPIQAKTDHPNLKSLDALNRWGKSVYLKSDDDVESLPEWLLGKSNIPSGPENCTDQARRRGSKLGRFKKSKGGRSDAPAVLIAVDKGNGVVDAFWFFFYSFNLGNKVLNIRFGNHVGDWEHTLVRFKDGYPEAVFLSEHDFGEAYTYDTVEKIGKRPVVYSAAGSHAMYATAGIHPYVLPLGLLHDETDRGPLWDPSQNLHSFTYDPKNGTVRSSTISPHAPVGWFYFEGRWGDKHYTLDDPRQYVFAGQYHYVDGPLGPSFKNLNRTEICQRPDRECIINNSLEKDRALRNLRISEEESSIS